MTTLLRDGRIASPPERASAVELGPQDDPGALAARLGERFHALPAIAVRFPVFTDGRGYSIARLLRERHGYRGELRAVGDVRCDQLHYLSRCGFDSFALRDGEDIAVARAALAGFSEAYQGSVERPLPLFRRRGAA